MAVNIIDAYYPFSLIPLFLFEKTHARIQTMTSRHPIVVFTASGEVLARIKIVKKEPIVLLRIGLGGKSSSRNGYRISSSINLGERIADAFVLLMIDD